MKNLDICYYCKHKFRYEEEPRTAPADNSLLAKLMRLGNEKETSPFERYKQSKSLYL